MFKQFMLMSLFLFSLNLYSQEVPQPNEIDVLRKRISELEEVQKENSEILKRQLTDQHIDQNSRGYVEVKTGLSMFKPDDVEDNNDAVFGDQEDASWEDFGHAKIFDIEIGKTIYSGEILKHDIGIGYQFLTSNATGHYSPSGGGSKITVRETAKFHTVFARYAALFKGSSNGKFFFGPGVTLGYSPIGELEVQLEQDGRGEKATGENSSYLVELFGKAKIQFTRYFSFVSTVGYRMQEAKNLKLSSGDVVDLRTSTDLDASGLFATMGLGVAF